MRSYSKHIVEELERYIHMYLVLPVNSHFW
ncbi:hypothetical protein GGQ92_003154 [Gracilibacillus halotolerans]|uniref:Uncharacterized protein n=1 Tax=Gracilibacillus halotolerans TaxID=74386 RepID=A0A841RJ88_9BACI|nr:hypothetical protein [Gracilibacillus halotolerans]